MPTFFLCFIVFIIWFRVKSKQSDKISTWDEDFWQRERNANFTRKQDISNLSYVAVDLSRLPISESPDADSAPYQDQIRMLSKKQLLNLNGMTNTDIKLNYGIGNFEKISTYDQNFVLLLRNLNQWGQILFEKREYQQAKQVFEYAIDLGSDITNTYLTLAKIYLEEDSIEKIQILINKNQERESFMQKSIQEKLVKIIQEY